MEATKTYLIPAGVAALLVGAAFGMGQRAGSQAATEENVDALKAEVSTLRKRVSTNASDVRVLKLRVGQLERHVQGVSRGSNQ